MERKDKISIIEAIQSGVPVDLALKYAGKKHIIAIRDGEDGIPFIDDKPVSEAEIKRLEKIPGFIAIKIINKSGMKLDSNGLVTKL